MNTSSNTAEVIAFPREETKVCNTCKLEKTVTEFHTKPAKNGNSRLSYQCKPCEHARKNRERGGTGEFVSLDHVRKLSPSGELLEKRCPTCETWKMPDQFYKKANTVHGVNHECKSCTDKIHYRKMRLNPDHMRDKNIQNQYGISLDDARALLEFQHGLCANRACGKEIHIDGPRNERKAFIDHCHSTGVVRGILCIRCNTALGLLEQKNITLGLMEYIENFPSKTRSYNRGN